MGISMHPVTSFDESDSTAILSRVLQSKRTIKTFLKKMIGLPIMMELLSWYTEHILADTLTDRTEIYIKSSFARNYSLKRRTSFDPISIYKSPEIQPLFKTFSEKYSADMFMLK